MKVRVFIASMLILSSALFADFSIGVSPLYADLQDTKAIGKLLPTAEVKVLQEEKSRIKVQISGYQDENTSVLYFTAGKRILNAVFDKKAKVIFKTGKTQEVDGKQYTKVETEVWMDKKFLTQQLQPLFDQAKDLFEQNCSMCHSLHQPKEFNSNQWPSVFKSMVNRTGIDKKDYQLVIQYLQKNAKDMQ